MDRTTDDLSDIPGYTLDRILSKGGMGWVYLGKSTSGSGQDAAIKVIHRDLAEDPTFRSRFRQEVAAARQVSSAFTAAVLDAAPDARLPWIATRFIPGPTLDQRVKAGLPFTPEELYRLAAGLAEALRDIHRAGIVHRGLKPSSVLLTGNGPRVIGFGIARVNDSFARSRTGEVVDTPSFMSPEQIRGIRDIGTPSDIFSLGSVMVYAATGHLPFPASDSRSLVYQLVHRDPDLADVPDWLFPIVDKCLRKKPEDRPDAIGLLSALGKTYSTTPTTTPPSESETLSASSACAALPDTAELQDPDTAGLQDPDTEAAPSPAVPAARPTRRLLVRLSAVMAAVIAASAALYQVAGKSGDTSGKGGADVRAAEPSSAAHATGWQSAEAAAYTASQSGGPAYTYTYRDSPERRPTGWMPWVSPTTKVLGRGSNCVFAENSLVCVGKAVIRIDAATGRRIWKQTSTQAHGQKTLAVVNDLAIVNTGKAIRALSLATGRKRWLHRFRIPTQHLIADSGTVYAAERSGRVHAVNAATGRRRWTTRPSRRNTTGHVPAIRSLSGRVYLLSGSGDDSPTVSENRVTVLDARSGKRLAEHRLGPGCVLGTAAMIRESGVTVLYCAVRDEERQRRGVLRQEVVPGGATATTWVSGIWDGGRMGTPELSVSPGRVYLVTGDTGSASLIAVDPVKRTVAWRTPIPGAGQVHTPPVHAGDRLYIAYNGGSAVFDPSAGKQLLYHGTPTATTDISSESEPLIAGGVVFLYSAERGWLSFDTTRR